MGDFVDKVLLWPASICDGKRGRKIEQRFADVLLNIYGVKLPNLSEDWRVSDPSTNGKFLMYSLTREKAHLVILVSRSGVSRLPHETLRRFGEKWAKFVIGTQASGKVHLLPDIPVIFHDVKLNYENAEGLGYEGNIQFRRGQVGFVLTAGESQKEFILRFFHTLIRLNGAVSGAV